MKILAIVSGEYGVRHVENIKAHGPDTWQIETWKTPPVFPPFIDDPDDFLPDEMAPADLILSFAEHKGAAELLPDIERIYQEALTLPYQEAGKKIYDEEIAEFYNLLLERTGLNTPPEQ